MYRDNTKSKFDFIVSQVFWAAIAWIWYKGLLFRCLGKYSQKESRLILLGVVLLFCVVGCLLEFRKQRNEFNIYMNLIAGYGFYAVLSYLPIRRTLVLTVLIVTAGLAAIYAVLYLFREIRNKEAHRKVLKRRILWACQGTRNIICYGLALIMLTIGVHTFFGTALLRPSTAPANISNIEEQTIANHMDELSLLREETWQTLSLEEKLNVLQTVANIEQRYLGLPYELNVGAADLREGMVGYYSENFRDIIINISSLSEDTAYDAVNAVAHEAYHSLQYRMIDAYDEAGEDMKQLRLYREAAIYKEEFADYIDGLEDFCSYYSQKCEFDARQYAIEAANDYMNRISAQDMQ